MAAAALVLATPLVSFNAIATDAQVARLRSGVVTPDRFGWAALAYDFGAPGKAAVAELARSADARIAAKAKEAGSSTHRYDIAEQTRLANATATLLARLTILPRRVPLPPALTAALAGAESCDRAGQRGCVLFYEAGATEAFALDESGLTPLTGRGDAEPAWLGCSILRLTPDDGVPIAREAGPEGAWQVTPLGVLGDDNDAAGAAERAAVRSRQVEVRTVQRRQVVVGGVPVGDVFE